MIQIKTGDAVVMLEEGRLKIDEGIVRDVTKSILKIESVMLHHGEVTEFAFFPEALSGRGGWRMLFEDPMTNRRCFSKRAPVYTFESL